MLAHSISQVKERFESKVEMIPFSECALWGGSNNRAGYGYFSINDKTCTAHRIAYELYVGPIPEGAHVLHTCHHGHLGCVSPDHLKLGTNADNMRDRSSSPRHRKGSAINTAKLTEADIPVIRARLAEGELQWVIANDYGLRRKAISRINTGETWSHV